MRNSRHIDSAVARRKRSQHEEKTTFYALNDSILDKLLLTKKPSQLSLFMPGQFTCFVSSKLILTFELETMQGESDYSIMKALWSTFQNGLLTHCL